jgi:NTP pyrophosphatase (non-canonical NTP hydrolase)
MKKELHQYQDFVNEITSPPSKNKEAFLVRINELYDQGCDVARLQTATDGLCSESGELKEIVKKMLFQGKPYNEDNKRHMMLELSDVLWYWMNGCISLGVDPYDVIDANIAKLQSRYPGGFAIQRSEVRKEGDI